MKYCHNCRYEFVDDVDECPDCGIPLQETPPGPREYKEVEWVALRDLSSPIYAEMIKEVLDQNNIPNYLSFDFLSSTFILRGASLVGESGKLYVPKDYEEQATEILDSMMDEIDDDETEDESE